MFRLKQTISEKYERIKAHHRVLKEVLDSDESLALMNLSYLHDHPNLYRFKLILIIYIIISCLI